MKPNSLTLLWPLLLLTAHCDCWRVLIANSLAGGSHQTVSLYLANLLADNGHHVTYVSTNIPKKLHTGVVKLELPTATRNLNHLIASNVAAKVNGEGGTWGDTFEAFRKLTHFCQDFYEEPNVQMLIKSDQQFDLLITFGASDCCGLSLGQHLKINNSALHIPGPFLIPSQIHNLGIPIYASSHNLEGVAFADSTALRQSMFARAKRLIKGLVADLFNSLLFRYAIDTVAYKHLPGYTGYRNLYGSVKMIFMHYHPHPLVDLPLPVGPGVINLGGTVCVEGYREEDIPIEMREFVDASPGFIVISFGSHVPTVTEKEQELWMKVISNLPYSVVWRLADHSLSLPDNIRTYKWLPQQALLQHPKIKLFISHGGYASKIESFCAGTPILFVPRFAEQFDTAELYTKLGIAEQVLMKPGETTVEEVTTKISKTIEVHSKTVSEISRQLLQTRITDNQVLGYLDMAVSGHGLLPGYQPWWQYFYLDLILVPLVVIVLVRCLIRKFRSSN